jgi:valyl-tRNA synthetase
MNCYKLVWNDFCSWLLETLKPAYQQPIDAKTKSACIRLFEDNLKILHPFMPFITEDLWHNINNRTKEEALIISEWPVLKSFDKEMIKNFDLTTEIITQIRSIRKSKNIPFKNSIDLKVENKENFDSKFDSIIVKLGHIEELSYVDQQQDGALNFSVKSNIYYIPVEGAIDVEAEIEKLEKDLDYYTGFLVSVDKKLSNKRFVDNAPEQVVNKEKQKQADALAKLESIKESIENLKA